MNLGVFQSVTTQQLSENLHANSGSEASRPARYRKKKTLLLFARNGLRARQKKKGPYPYPPSVPNLFLEQFLVAYFSIDL